MRRWAFARISLKLSDAEFFRYTPAQIDALTEAFEQERSWELAVATASALNSKWSRKDNALPFTPSDFMKDLDVDEAEERRREHQQQKFEESMIELQFKSLTNELCQKRKQNST